MRRQGLHRGWRALALGWLLLAAGIVRAHDPGLSSANIDVAAGEVRSVMTFNARDIAQLRDPSAATTAEQAAALVIDGRAIGPRKSSASKKGDGGVELVQLFDMPRESKGAAYRSLLLERLPFGHRQAVAITDGAGHEIGRRMLSASDNSIAIPTTSGPARATWPGSFLEFVGLGVRHILTGYDHLLFLFALLVMCRTARSAALLITCFTAAHSISLCLSTFGFVNIESRLTESAIAVSIIFVGAENLLRGERRIPARWLVTFAFGLVHGLGFASVLREMGIARTGVAAIVPLASFNVGVEIGQLGIAAIILPAVWALRRQRWFVPAGVQACSAVVVAAGSYWLLARTLF